MVEVNESKSFDFLCVYVSYLFMACPTNYALQLHKKATASASATANTCRDKTPGTRRSPCPPRLACPKLELTFLKLNESAVSGKWISNFCLKTYYKKSLEKYIYIYKTENGKRKAKLTEEIRLKYASSDCCALPAFATFPAGRPGLKVEKNETFMSFYSTRSSWPFSAFLFD